MFGTDHSEDLGIDETTIYKYFLKKMGCWEFIGFM